MAKTRTYVHDEHTLVDAAGNEIVMYHKNTLKDVVMDEKSKVTAVGKLIFSASCSTAGNVASKVVDAPGYVLMEGSHIVVKFVNPITTLNTTMNINNTGAKAIVLNGEPVPAGVISANNQIILKYNGTAYDVVGGAGSTQVKPDTTKKIYFIGIDDPTTNGSPTDEYFNTDIYVDAGGKKLTAPYFVGDGSNITNMTASQLTTGTMNAGRLPDSGVATGTYGTEANATLGFSNTFNVPKITVDRYGRVTSASNVSLTLPANPDTDVKVTSAANNSSTYYLAGTTSSATATGTLIHNTGVYVSGSKLHATTAMYTPTLYLNTANTSYINATSYTGTAAAVSGISGHVADSYTSTSTTTAASANVARLLANGVNTVNTRLNTLVGQLGTQATFSLSGTTLTITTKTAPSTNAAVF